MSKPFPFEARAWLDGKLVATSTAALQLEPAGELPILCFPASDVHGEVPGAAEVTLSAAPHGYVAFDSQHARVRVAITDAAPGEAERDHTVKRYPVWGDAADLIRLLDVQPDPAADGGYVSAVYDSPANRHRGVVEGSQMLAQSLVAASRRAPGRRVVRASMVFMRAAGTAEPLRIQLEEQSGGRNFSVFAAHVRQGDKLCASGTLMLDAMAPDVMRHAAAAPETLGPYESKPHDMSVTGRDVRFVDGAYTGDPDAPVGPPNIDAWVRFRHVPEDPALHAGLLAHFTGHVSIATAMRAHAGIGQNQAHRTLSTAINAITLSFHASPRADRWMHYHHHSTFAGDGMTHAANRVYDAEGNLLASFSVDAMVRRFSADRKVDGRTSL